ncbi:MAG: ATP-binding protein [Patescibacteria group bacterium]|nr:ATP-binding protein [Patescibacteria group bacterium]
MKIDKSILTWTKDDLEVLRDDPYNLEDMNIEYKVQYNRDVHELRRDIVSFANSEVGGYILYGIRDDPFELIGMIRGEVDKLKNTIDHIINLKIDPRLDPPPISHPIYLNNNLYVLGVQVFPKQSGIYAIRRNNNSNKPDFRLYSFWIRSDGRKRQISMEEVNSYIIKTDPYKKRIEVRIHINTFLPDLGKERLISINGVNKSIRPIIVNSYGFQVKNDNDKGLGLFIQPPNLHPGTRFNTSLPIKLQDGELCSAYYPIKNLKEDLAENNITLPISIKGVINTTDGMFYSEEKELSEKML